jgi:hypothetical protein
MVIHEDRYLLIGALCDYEVVAKDNIVRGTAGTGIKVISGSEVTF